MLLGCRIRGYRPKTSRQHTSVLPSCFATRTPAPHAPLRRITHSAEVPQSSPPPALQALYRLLVQQKAAARPRPFGGWWVPGGQWTPPPPASSFFQVSDPPRVAEQHPDLDKISFAFWPFSALFGEIMSTTGITPVDHGVDILDIITVWGLCHAWPLLCTRRDSQISCGSSPWEAAYLTNKLKIQAHPHTESSLIHIP